MIERPSLDIQIAPDQELPTATEALETGAEEHTSTSSNTTSPEHWEAMKSQQMSRRHLLTLVKAGSGVIAATALLAACGGSATDSGSVTTSAPTTAPAPTQAAATPTQAPTVAPTPTQAAQGASTAGGSALAHVADIPVNGAKTFTIANQQNPGVLIHLSDQNFVAYDSTCTHQQCAVAYDAASKLLKCPCHGAAFDPAKNGAVVQGPAQSPLSAIKISVGSDGTITKA